MQSKTIARRQASREHYCINKTVMKKANRDEECEKLMSGDGGSCQYSSNTPRLFPMQFNGALQV